MAACAGIDRLYLIRRPENIRPAETAITRIPEMESFVEQY